MFGRYPDFRELFGVGNRQRADAEGVEQLKDRGIRADAQRERQNRDRGKDRIQTEQPRAMAEVPHERLEEADGVHAIDVLADEGGVAKLSPRRVARVAQRHAAGEVLVDLDRQVRVELARPLVVPAAAEEELRKAHRVPLQTSDFLLHAGLNTRLMALTISSQRLVCSVSCLRPSGVRR